MLVEGVGREAGRGVGIPGAGNVVGAVPLVH